MNVDESLLLGEKRGGEEIDVVFKNSGSPGGSVDPCIPEAPATAGPGVVDEESDEFNEGAPAVGVGVADCGRVPDCEEVLIALCKEACAGTCG